MADPIDQTTSVTDGALSNPQAMVDAALGSSPEPTSPEPIVTTVAPSSVPPIAPVAPIQTPAPTPLVTPTPSLPPLSPISPAPASNPMGDETPLSFMTTTTTTTSSAPNTPLTSAPQTPPTISTAPIEPKKTGGKGKVVGMVVGALLLVLGIAGGLVGYNYYSKPAQVAKVSNGECGYCDGATCVKCTGYPGEINNGQCKVNTDCGPKASPPKPSSGGGGGGGGGSCAAPKQTCGSSCVNLNNDVNNCGSCGNVCSGNYPICENKFCKSATDAQCTGAGQEPCTTKYADFGLGHTCCAKGYKCDVGDGYDNGCVKKNATPKPSDNPPETHKACNTTTFQCKTVDGAGADTCTTDTQCAPVPVLACTGITSAPTVTTPPAIGGKVTFTCAGTLTPPTAGTLSYKFRYSINAGTALPLANKTATTAELTIATCGSYSVQCQACATLGGVLKCNPTWTGATQ